MLGDNLEILISLGTNAADALPVRTAATWDSFVQWLQALPRSPAGISAERYAYLKGFPSKSPEGMELHADKSGPYVVLADFGGQRRHLDNVLGSYGVPLDFDGGHVTPDLIRSTLAGYAFVAYSTYAHGTPEANGQPSQRWRVFVPVARSMSAAEHYATWEMLSSAFSRAADPAAKDPSRLSYLPGKCLYPEHAELFHSAGAFLQPAPVIEAPPSALQAQTSDGPVPGWAGPTDDETLLAIACSKRMRPDEMFGSPVHFAMLWTANEEWLGAKFPPSSNEAGQAYSRTQADMALAGELAYFTGNDAPRMLRLMLASGLARADDDWKERKVLRAIERACENAKKWHFMEKAAPPMAVTMGSDGSIVPPAPPSAADVNVANMAAMPGLNDYWAYLPTAQFIHRPTGMLHVASSVDGTIGKDCRAALVTSRPVHRMTWAPGYPERFQTKDMDPTDERGSDSWLYNRYQPPREPKLQGDVSPWLDLVRSLYPDDADHLIAFFADAVQHADKKCNHGIVLGSSVHGIGKDTLLAPVRFAVGERNFWSIKPSDLVGSYNPWVATRILQVSESRDLGEGSHGVSRYEIYERCKDLLAAPPTMLACVDKYVPQHQVVNVLRVILTTNHMIDGIYLPPEDRRHYCAWSNAQKMTPEDSGALWAWYEAGGMDFVHYYLAHYDLEAAGFNRKAAPRQTDWWHTLVNAAKPEEDTNFSDALEKLGRPDWVTLDMLSQAGGTAMAGWLGTPGNRRKIARQLSSSGYIQLRNKGDAARGRWFINGQRITIYGRTDINPKELEAIIMAGQPVPVSA